MKFADVKNDVAFHKVFGNAKRTITLISFLNAVLNLEGNQRIESVTIENPYHFPPITGGKTVVLDISATDEAGRKFIVEMQVADKEGFLKRAQYYVSRDYSAQISRGDEYEKLRPTHFIGILNFNISDTAPDDYLSHHATLNLKTGELLLADVQYFFIELEKFRKAPDDLETLVDKWIYFIKNAENLALIPENVTDEGLRAAYQEANQHSWTPAELKAYDNAAMLVADAKNERAKALNVGRKEGSDRTIKAIVIAMHKEGLPLSTIAKITELSEEAVQQIIADELKK